MEIKTKSEQQTASVRVRTSVERLKEEFATGYAEIAAALERQGTTPTGAPYALYYNMDMQDLDVEMGFPVAGPFKPEGRIKKGVLPGGRTAMHTHKGPYEAIHNSYNALSEFMAEQKVVPKGLCYESYLTDPGTTPPEDLVTEINFPLTD